MNQEEFKKFKELNEINLKEYEYWTNEIRVAFQREDRLPDFNYLREELNKTVQFYLKMNKVGLNEKKYQSHNNFVFKIVEDKKKRVCIREYKHKIKQWIDFDKVCSDEKKHAVMVLYEVIPDLKKIVDVINESQERMSSEQYAKLKVNLPIPSDLGLPYTSVEVVDRYGNYEYYVNSSKTSYENRLNKIDYSDQKIIDGVVKPMIAAVIEEKEKIKVNKDKCVNRIMKAIANSTLGDAHQARKLCEGI